MAGAGAGSVASGRQMEAMEAGSISTESTVGRSSSAAMARVNLVLLLPWISDSRVLCALFVVQLCGPLSEMSVRAKTLSYGSSV